METINKAQFREFVSEYSRITVGDIYYNDGVIYNKKENGKMSGFSYVGTLEERINDTTNYLWRKARKHGSVIINGKEYQVL